MKDTKEKGKEPAIAEDNESNTDDGFVYRQKGGFGCSSLARDTIEENMHVQPLAIRDLVSV